jgi:hypothetical protein
MPTKNLKASITKTSETARNVGHKIVKRLPPRTVEGFQKGRKAGNQFVEDVPFNAGLAIGFSYGATESVVGLLATPVNALIGWATRAIGCGGRVASANSAETEMA